MFTVAAIAFRSRVYGQSEKHEKDASKGVEREHEVQRIMVISCRL